MSNSDQTHSHHEARQASGSGCLEVRCPNCHAPTEVAVDTSLTDLTCSACGSHFSLVDQAKATHLAPSLTQLGRFELVERLGVGGFGSVWKARDVQLDRTVAIKIPRQGQMTSEEQEKFFREARAAAQLRHPNIVSVHEVGRDGESIYIVSDFVRGVTLGDWLTGQQLTGREAAELCAQIADALHHAHEHGVIHRDLKPANIMMDRDGQPHLMDFGLARRDTGEVTMTVEGQILGTPAYMSPEQAEGAAHTADRRSDVYSLGVILFQLLTGELPFRGNARMLIHQVINEPAPSPRKLNSNVNKDLETITLKCLEKQPSRRYQTAQEVAQELRRVLANEPIQARPIGRIERVWRWCLRYPLAAALSALLVVSLTSGVIVSTVLAVAANRSAARFRQERDRAEGNLRIAERAVDQYLTEVAEDERLKKADFHQLRAELLETAVPFYEQFAEQESDDQQGELKRANAYARIADIYGSTGQYDRSMVEYEKAVAVLKELTTRFPEVAEYARVLAKHEADLGWRFHETAKRDEAKSHYDSALSILEGLRARFPERTEYKRMSAQLRTRYGMLVRYADPEDGRKHFEQALKLQRALVLEFPKEVGYQGDVAGTCYYLGYMLRQAEPHLAKEYLSESTTILRRLGTQSGEPSGLLAESTLSLGGLHFSMDDADQGRRLVEEGIAIQTNLVSQFPSVVGYRLGLARMLRGYAKRLATLGDLTHAVEEYEKALPMFENLVSEFPNVPVHVINASGEHVAFAGILQQAGKQVEARAHYARAGEMLDKLAAEHPDVLEYGLQAANRHYQFALVLKKMGDDDASRTEYQKEIELRIRIATQFDDNASRQNGAAVVLTRTPIAELRNGAQAIKFATKACELTQYENAEYLSTLAAAYAENGDFHSAVKWCEKSLESTPDTDEAGRKIISQRLKVYKSKITDEKTKSKHAIP